MKHKHIKQKVCESYGAIAKTGSSCCGYAIQLSTLASHFVH